MIQEHVLFLRVDESLNWVEGEYWDETSASLVSWCVPLNWLSSSLWKDLRRLMTVTTAVPLTALSNTRVTCGDHIVRSWIQRLNTQLADVVEGCGVSGVRDL